MSGFKGKHPVVSGLVIIWLGILLAACGAEPTQTPAPTTTAATTRPATTAAAVATVAATTAAPTTQAVTTTAATTVAPTPTTAQPATTLAGPTVPPTFTTGPTPVAQAPAKGWWSNGVCYEIFVRSFYDSNGDGIGDIPGLISKLDYIKGLGANCLWLMPVMQSPSYHGYDTTDFYSVNKQYGTNDDFKKLMQAAHARGIYILIDFVINHTSDQHPWFVEAQDPNSPKHNWYIWSDTDPAYKGPWGATAWWKKGNQYYYGVFDASQPDLNFRNPDVTKEIYNVSRFWLQDMGVDGFRLDAAKHLIEDGRTQIDTPETKAWLRDWEKYLKGIKPDVFTVGEVNQAGGSDELKGFWPDQLDSYFEFGMAEAMIKSAATNNPTPFFKAVDYAQTNWPFQRWSTFLTNHDQNRVMNRFQGDIPQMKLAATMLLTAPGLPFLYYGEEIGQQGSKPDENIRTPMQWEGNSDTAGFTAAKPWRTPNSSVTTANVAGEDKDPNSLLNYYRKLIALRRDSAALSNGNWIALTSDKETVGAYIRQSQGDTVLVILNLDAKPVENPALSLEKSELKAGQFSGQELLQGAAVIPLTVGDNGSIKGAVPLSRLEARTAYIIKLASK
jgi:glycosidase